MSKSTPVAAVADAEGVRQKSRPVLPDTAMDWATDGQVFWVWTGVADETGIPGWLGQERGNS